MGEMINQWREDIKKYKCFVCCDTGTQRQIVSIEHNSVEEHISTGQNYKVIYITSPCPIRNCQQDTEFHAGLKTICKSLPPSESETKESFNELSPPQ